MTAARCPERGANRGLKTFGRAREGGVAVVVGLSIFVLVGAAALALADFEFPPTIEFSLAHNVVITGR